MTTRIDIINRQLLRIGSEPLQSEQADGADSHLAIYDSVLEDLISRYPWTFCTMTRRLVQKSQAPAQRWLYAYALPSDMLGSPRAVYDSESRRAPLTDFELSTGELQADAASVWMTFQTKPSPVFWPGYFRELVVLAGAAEMALSVREDKTLRDVLRNDCYGTPSQMGEGGLFGQAKNYDAQSKPSPVVAEGVNPLIAVRY